MNINIHYYGRLEVTTEELARTVKWNKPLVSHCIHCVIAIRLQCHYYGEREVHIFTSKFSEAAVYACDKDFKYVTDR